MRRTFAALASVFVLISLAGCSVRGTVDLNEDDTVTIDITQVFRADEPYSCVDIDGASSEGSFGDQPSCRIRTTLPLDHIAGRANSGVITLRHLGSYDAIAANWVYDPLTGATLDSIDLTVNLRGRVYNTTAGELRGTSVHFTDPSDIKAGNLSILAASARDELRWVVAGASGLAGALVAALAWNAIGRRRRPNASIVTPADGDTPHSDTTNTVVATDESADEGEDPSVWAPPPGGGA